MRKLLLLTLFTLISTFTFAQGWPEKYQGVMLQGFYWDSFTDSRWKVLERQADEFAPYFSLVWLPQSGNCGGNQSMGYDDLYWFNNYNSSFGTEAELRSLISTFKAKGIGTIADVVINHRKNVSSWVDFPKETYKGVTYELKSTDICSNDDGGATRNWANANGYSLSSNPDTGEDWGGMRDLDHNSANVQRTVNAYLDFLQNDLGYIGFRYDMVKGYAGRFTGLYNSTAKPVYSVGEYWDGNVAMVQNWLNATKVDNKIQSAAFDFPFRYVVRDAVNNGNWGNLASTSTLAANNAYKRYSVTFVENHDTEYRSSSDQQDPIRRDTLAANAFMLAMPGTPCVFFKHWIDHKRDIAKMILLRNICGVNNQSTYSQYDKTASHYAHVVNGTYCQLLCVVGKDAATYRPANIAGWHCIASGYHWAYWTSEPVNLPEISFPEDKFEPYNITVGVDVSAAGWGTVNFWTWGGDGTHSPTNKNWPGDKVTNTTTINGRTFYTRQYRINSAKDYVSFVFSTGSGSPQTVDVPNVTTTSYFAVSKSKNGEGKYMVDDITTETPVVAPTATDAKPTGIYTIDGRRVSRPANGLYIVNGKKTVIR